MSLFMRYLSHIRWGLKINIQQMPLTPIYSSLPGVVIAEFSFRHIRNLLTSQGEKICQKTILDTAAKVGRKQRKKNL